MKNKNLAFVDIEATGLNPDKHEIIEIGCIITKPADADFAVVDEFEVKVKPEHIETAEAEALRINGYNEMDWLFAVDLAKAMELFANKTAGAMLVAQNVTFDWSFLERAFAKTGVENKMDYHRLDLPSMAYIKLYNDERIQRFSLRALCEHFGIKNEKAHTALSDIRATVEVYKKLLG